MVRLPIPGQDNGTWGDILNDFLQVEINADGSLKLRTDGTFVPSSKYGAKGTIVVGTGSSASTGLALGTDGQVLTADSSQTSGVRWASGGGGGSIAGASDAAISSPANGQVLSYNSGTSKWVNHALVAADVSGVLATANNLSELSGTASTARTNLGLGGAATLNVGTGAGTVAAGNDTRITGAEQTANRGANNGYAPLNASAQVPTLNLPVPFSQSNTHASPDTDSAPTALHHTLGTGANQAAAGNHTHTLTLSLTPFFKQGVLTTTTGASRLPIDGTYTIVGTRLMVNTAPTGANLIIDVNKNGTSIYTTQANRPTITAGSNAGGPGSAPDITTLAAGDYLTVDVDQIGSSVAGSDLTVTIVVTKTVS